MKHVYMIGIKGVGMASLALVYHRMGYQVTGSDVATKFITDDILKKYGIQYHIGFDAKNIPGDADFAVISAAFTNEENPEYKQFFHADLPLYTHAEALGKLMDAFSLKISVCGSHGKTTTSAMLAYIFSQSALKGAHCLGVPSFSGLDGGAYTGTDYFVAEADEYANKPPIDNTPRFNFQHPDILVCTNIDFDHPDIYPSLRDLQQAFKNFMMQVISQNGKVVYSADDRYLSKMVKELAYDALYSYGTSHAADLVISDIKDTQAETSFHATYRNEDIGSFALGIGGLHNIENAAATILTCKLSGIDEQVVRKALQSFTGSQRRFEFIYRRNNTFLIDDYAHHPREISAVIDATRHKFPGYKVIVVFQPHTYSRTEAMKEEFVAALKKADIAYVMMTFSSEREKTTTETSLLNPLLGQAYSLQETVQKISQHIANDTVIITMGAGDIYTLHPHIIDLIKKSK